MRSTRHTGQYSFQTEPTLEELESAMNSAQKFIKRMEKLLEETDPLVL